MLKTVIFQVESAPVAEWVDTFQGQGLDISDK